ncbi:MAG: isoprenyl transferase [Mariniblastus sp.]|nr:isoprenyl transferase [Mariniblastus sp.]
MSRPTDIESLTSGEELPNQPTPLEIPTERRPRHIAVIMDGNGRWAQRQNQPRIVGHENGAASVRTVTEECARLGIGQLTLYCLSSENWKRPAEELDFLMHLLQEYLIQERELLLENNIRLKMIGRRDRLPADVLEEMDRSLALTANNTGLTLCLAINYGSRGEIVDAIRGIATEVQAGQLEIDQIEEATVSEHLYTQGMADPDLLIRTAGEMRISNYLLWQISYAELWITEKLWPEFGIAELHQAIRNFASRDRRYGGLSCEIARPIGSTSTDGGADQC